MAGLRYIEDVVTLELDRDACSGCGMCLAVCPHGVFALDGNRARIADRNACIECGACARNCPEGALGVTPGVGCAAAIIIGWLRGSEPTCGSEPDCGSGGCC